MNWFPIVSDNVLSPDRHQAIIWTNAGILLIKAFGINQWNLIQNTKLFIPLPWHHNGRDGVSKQISPKYWQWTPHSSISHAKIYPYKVRLIYMLICLVIIMIIKKLSHCYIQFKVLKNTPPWLIRNGDVNDVFCKFSLNTIPYLFQGTEYCSQKSLCFNRTPQPLPKCFDLLMVSVARFAIARKLFLLDLTHQELCGGRIKLICEA